MGNNEHPRALNVSEDWYFEGEELNQYNDNGIDITYVVVYLGLMFVQLVYLHVVYTNCQLGLYLRLLLVEYDAIKSVAS